MLNFDIKFSFGGIYRIWDEIRIESISNLRQWITNDYNSNWQIIYKKDNEQSFIYQWKDNIIKVLIYPLCILESYDESSMGMIKAINFPNEYIDDTDKINISFPLLFLSKIINRNEEYEKRYKESIIFDLEKQEILSRKNYPLFSILTTNQEFLFCLSPDLKKLECFDIFQGQHEVWDFDFEAEGYGVLKNEPPAQYLDMLLFMVRGKESPSTLAIDSQTGKKRWYCEMGHLPNVSCTYNGNLVSYRGIWYI